MTKNKKRKAHTRARAQAHGVSYRTALHQEQGGGQLPPDFRIEMVSVSLRGETPYGLRVRVPGIEAPTWLDNPSDMAAVMRQVVARVEEEFQPLLADFRLWLQMGEPPELDISLDNDDWALISFHQAYAAVEEVLLGAVQNVGWGSWGMEERPLDVLDTPSLKDMFDLVEESLMRNATEAHKAALAPFWAQARAAAMGLDASACAVALRSADPVLRALGWESDLGWADEESWDDDDDEAYDGPETFTLFARGHVRAASEGESPDGLVLRVGDEYEVRAQGRLKLNDGRRCVLLSHGALSGELSVVRVRFLDTGHVVSMDPVDLHWAARGR